MLLSRPGSAAYRPTRTRAVDSSRVAMFHRVSLKTILIGGAILAAVIPAVLVGIALVGSLHDSAIRDATARHELLAQGLASEHDRFLTSHRQAVQMLTRHVENHRSLGEGGVAPLLAQTRASYPEFAAIAILDPSGRVVASDPPTTEDGRSTTAIDLSDRAWFREIVQGRRVIVYPDVEVSRHPPERLRSPDRRSDLGRIRRTPGSGRRLAPARRHSDPHQPDPLRQYGVCAPDDGGGQDPRPRERGLRPGTQGFLPAADLVRRQSPRFRPDSALCRDAR